MVQCTKKKMATLLLNSKEHLNKRFWENIHFGRVMVWYGANQMIIHFSKASILSYSRYSIHIFIQIILLENSWCSKELNKLCSPNSSDDLCLLFLLPWYVIPCCHAVWQHMGLEYGLQREGEHIRSMIFMLGEGP